VKLPKLNMTLGADPKKLAVLGALLALAGYFFYTNVLSSGGETSSARAAVRKSPSLVESIAVPAALERSRSAGAEQAPSKTAVKDFRPSLKPRKGEEHALAESDPTLRLDILEKLAAVKIERVERSLFDFSTLDTAKPKLPEPKIEVKKPAPKMIGPELPPPPPPPVVKPPPPPIPLKFFGNALPQRGGAKRVFCLQGDEILAPAEGEVIQRRYKIIRINANSVLVEDLDYKNQQTLPIEEPPQAG
jgi:hypothetical protein